MDELARRIEEILRRQPGRWVFSLPRDKSGPCKKALLRLTEPGWQLERHTETQVFHQNGRPGALAGTVHRLLCEEFREAHAFYAGGQAHLRMSKKEKPLVSFGGGDTGPAPEAAHDRQKPALLPEGQPIPALEEMGVFTSAGRVARGMQAKYRQVNRYLEMVDDLLRGKDLPALRVVDFGCGKSTLTFALYHYLRQVRGIDAEVLGVDQKTQVIENCQRAAQKHGYEGLRFAAGDIAAFAPEGPVDMVVALHACDTATDLALAHAVSWGARFILAAPCCQHELNAQMQSEALPLLSRYGVVQERACALMTDAIRASLLTACGYKTQILEFVQLSDTPKNLLIRAEKTGQPQAVRAAALAEVRGLCEAFGFSPALRRLLAAGGALPAG